jgi:hypothetical protein
MKIYYNPNDPKQFSYSPQNGWEYAGNLSDEAFYWFVEFYCAVPTEPRRVKLELKIIILHIGPIVFLALAFLLGLLARPAVEALGDKLFHTVDAAAEAVTESAHDMLFWATTWSELGLKEGESFRFYPEFHYGRSRLLIETMDGKTFGSTIKVEVMAIRKALPDRWYKVVGYNHDDQGQLTVFVMPDDPGSPWYAQDMCRILNGPLAACA